MVYDTTNIDDNVSVTLDWILARVTDYDIYTAYIGEFKVGRVYNSPLRKDKNPSFSCFYSRDKTRILFKDHGTGDYGDVIKLVSLITGLTNYVDILNDIVKKLKLTNDAKLVSSKHYIPSTETVIGVVRQEFTPIDIDYWSQFHISTDTLKKFGVSSIKYYLCNGVVKGIYKDTNPMYAYKVYNHFKIYRPLADKYTKWRNNLTQSDVQGYKQLPKTGDTLIITKSLKDVMCLYEMGIPAISPSSETTFLTDRLVKALLKRFKRILVCLDRDVCGVRNLRKISLKMPYLRPLLVNKRYKAKDISDAVKLNGFETIKDWLENELRRTRKEV